MTTTYVGIVDGLHTYEVRDESGDLVGTNQSAYPPFPGEGWVLDENACTWIQA